MVERGREVVDVKAEKRGGDDRTRYGGGESAACGVGAQSSRAGRYRGRIGNEEGGRRNVIVSSTLAAWVGR